MPAYALSYLLNKVVYDPVTNNEFIPTVKCSNKNHIKIFSNEVLNHKTGEIGIWDSELRGPCPDFNIYNIEDDFSEMVLSSALMFLLK